MGISTFEILTGKPTKEAQLKRFKTVVSAVHSDAFSTILVSLE
jgi:hypothetical protein